MAQKMIVILFLLALPIDLLAFKGASTFTVINTNDSGLGSLREAVVQFNNGHREDDCIEFELPVAGPVQIDLLSDIEITRWKGLIFSIANQISIRGNGLLIRKYSGVKLVGINRIQQPKSLLEIALKAAVQRAISLKLDKNAFLKSLPKDLHDRFEEEYSKQQQHEADIKHLQDQIYVGPWDLQIAQGVQPGMKWNYR